MIPWVGMVGELQFQFQAMLEGVLVGQGSRSGLVVAVDQAATAAAERGHKLQSESTCLLGGLGGEAGQWGMVDLEAFRDHFHCSEDTDQRDIQDPDGRCRA